MWRKVLVFAAKELRVIGRDRAALAILFLMPIAFVTLMSLALRDVFREGAGPRATLVVLDADAGVLADAIVAALGSVPLLAVERRAADPAAVAATRDALRRGDLSFALELPAGLTDDHGGRLARASMADLTGPGAGERIRLPFLADPAVRGDHAALVRAAVAGAIASVELQRIRARFTGGPFPGGPVEGTSGLPGWLSLDATAPSSAAARTRPTATQQNVPAYALLAVFMLVVPLSATFIREREQGSLARLASMPVPAAVVLGGKVLPFLAVNLAQFALCLVVGRYLLPVLGGDRLDLGGSPAGLVALAIASSLAAIGFALVVAIRSRTVEQATAFGATSVLLLAAVGGIMVPRAMMPDPLQALGGYSPLAWALDGYLDLFLRAAGLAEVLPRAGALMAFAAACFVLAWRRFPLAASVR